MKTIKKDMNNIPANNTKITALYNRVSTDAQAEEGFSLEAMEQKLKQWCKLKDIKNYEMYTDGGWSGSNLERPEMKRLISDILNDKVERVVVYKLDRLSRSQKDTLFLLEDIFEPHHVGFVSLNENFDTFTAYGKAMIGTLSVFSQLERETIRVRTAMGMYERVKSGLWKGGNSTPFGYDYDANKDTLVPNKHADDVVKIYDLYLQGYSTTKLATMFPVCSDRHITQILDRVTYLGKICYKGEIFEGKHQPIIDENTWNKVQIERKKRSTKNVVTSNYLLTGLLVCGKCGAKMRYQKWTKDKVKIYCYSQQKNKTELIKDPDCDNLKYNSEDIEMLVIEDLFRITDSIVADADSIFADRKNKLSGIELLQQKHDLLSAKIKRLYNLYAENESELLLETIDENQKELNSITKLLLNEKASVLAIEDIRDNNAMVKNLRQKWNSMTISEKRKALRICIDKIVVTDEAIDIHYLI